MVPPFVKGFQLVVEGVEGQAVVWWVLCCRGPAFEKLNGCALYGAVRLLHIHNVL